MARPKGSKNSSRPKFNELPKGYKAISGLGGSWDYKKQPLLEGTIVSFKDVPSTKFFEGKGKNKTPKIQRLCNIMTASGEVGVWESAGTRALFGLKKGKKVAVLFKGLKKIPGRNMPMKLFDVGIM